MVSQQLQKKIRMQSLWHFNWMLYLLLHFFFIISSVQLKYLQKALVLHKTRRTNTQIHKYTHFPDAKHRK